MLRPRRARAKLRTSCMSAVAAGAALKVSVCGCCSQNCSCLPCFPLCPCNTAQSSNRPSPESKRVTRRGKKGHHTTTARNTRFADAEPGPGKTKPQTPKVLKKNSRTHPNPTPSRIGPGALDCDSLRCDSTYLGGVACVCCSNAWRRLGVPPFALGAALARPLSPLPAALARPLTVVARPPAISNQVDKEHIRHPHTCLGPSLGRGDRTPRISRLMWPGAFPRGNLSLNRGPPMSEGDQARTEKNGPNNHLPNRPLDEGGVPAERMEQHKG